MYVCICMYVCIYIYIYVNISVFHVLKRAVMWTVRFPYPGRSEHLRRDFARAIYMYMYMYNYIYIYTHV